MLADRDDARMGPEGGERRLVTIDPWTLTVGPVPFSAWTRGKKRREGGFRSVRPRRGERTPFSCRAREGGRGKKGGRHLLNNALTHTQDSRVYLSAAHAGAEGEERDVASSWIQASWFSIGSKGPEKKKKEGRGENRAGLATWRAGCRALADRFGGGKKEGKVSSLSPTNLTEIMNQFPTCLHSFRRGREKGGKRKKRGHLPIFQVYWTETTI